MINPAIFRAYDIRGVVDTDLTPDAVRLVGRAFAAECAAQGLSRVCVARDGRLSGPALAQALSEGLRAGGMDVLYIGMVPTPTLYWSTFAEQTGTGIMITGSHNPPEYNGLKMMMGGHTLYGDAIQALYQRIAQGVPEGISEPLSGAQQHDVPQLAAYLDDILARVSLARPMKIGVDCGSGVTGVCAVELFERLGCEVVPLFTEVDGTFPFHHPDPAKPENLADLKQVVLEQGCDLGLAFDGDGDRVGVVDNMGETLWPDRQMILLSRDVLSRNPGARIIFDVKCSRLLPAAIREAGGVPEMYKTGHSLIKARLKETGALLGGEMSGHVFFKERWYGFDDALYTAARFLEIIAAQTRSVNAVFADIPDSVNTPELNVIFAEGEHHRFVQDFVAMLQGEMADEFAAGDVNTIDGIRVDFADAWGLVRASNTTPSLVIRFEADDDAALQRVQTLFRRAMLATQADINLPF